MWSRFTERAKRSVFFAQRHASDEGEGADTGALTSEHLLLGLLDDEQSGACKLLMRRGIAPSQVRRALAQTDERGAESRSAGGQLTPEAKKAIDLARDEAQGMRSGCVGTEHLLLGLMGEPNGVAGRTLLKLGLELGAMRGEAASLRPAALVDADAPTTPARRVVSAWRRLLGRRRRS